MQCLAHLHASGEEDAGGLGGTLGQVYGYVKQIQEVHLMGTNCIAG